MTRGGILVLGWVKRKHPQITQIAQIRERHRGIERRKAKRAANGRDCLFGTDDSLRSLSVAPGKRRGKAKRIGLDYRLPVFEGMTGGGVLVLGVGIWGWG